MGDNLIDNSLKLGALFPLLISSCLWQFKKIKYGDFLGGIFISRKKKKGLLLIWLGIYHNFLDVNVRVFKIVSSGVYLWPGLVLHCLFLLPINSCSNLNTLVLGKPIDIYLVKYRYSNLKYYKAYKIKLFMLTINRIKKI